VIKDNNFQQGEEINQLKDSLQKKTAEAETERDNYY
jgi:hypothetical protein